MKLARKTSRSILSAVVLFVCVAPASAQSSGSQLKPFDPNRPILYVDITPISEIAVYQYDEKGRLSFVRTVSDSGVAPCWVVVNHTGTRLYATNTGDNSIAVYDLTDPLNPAEIQHFEMTATTGAAFSTVIDQSEEWIYVSSEQSGSTATPAANAFHSLKVSADGTLTEPFSPTVLPIGGTKYRYARKESQWSEQGRLAISHRSGRDGSSAQTLRSALDALHIPVESQMAIFSKASATPTTRALFSSTHKYKRGVALESAQQRRHSNPEPEAVESSAGLKQCSSTPRRGVVRVCGVDCCAGN